MQLHHSSSCSNSVLCSNSVHSAARSVQPRREPRVASSGSAHVLLANGKARTGLRRQYPLCMLHSMPRSAMRGPWQPPATPLSPFLA